MPANGPVKKSYPANTPTRKARSELAQVIGEDAAQIRIETPDWNRLMQMGIVARLHLHRWRASGKMTREDLGITVADDEERMLWQEYLNLGQKRLLPARVLNELNSIDVTARSLLDKFSFQTFWGRFVPCTAYPKWKAENEALRALYYAKRDEIIAEYDELVGQARAAYVVAGQRAWDRLVAAGVRPDLPRGDYGQRFADRVMGAVPDRQYILQSFRFEVDLSYIPLPSLLVEDSAEGQRLYAERAREDARLQADLQMERERVEQERKRQQSETDLTLSAAQYRERLMREMQADVLAKARREKEALIDGFWADVRKDLHKRIYSVLVSVLESIKRNENKLLARSVVALKNLVESVSALNFWGAEDLEGQIQQIRAILDTEADDRNVGDIEAALREIALIARQTLLELGERPRAARSIGIEDVPMEVETVRRVRGQSAEADDEEDQPEAFETGRGRKARSVA